MSGAGLYLGPHEKKGPGSYEMGPVHINAPRLPSFNGSQGLYINTGIGDENRRGSSLGSGKLSPLTPFIWDDFMGIHRDYQLVIDNEFDQKFVNVIAATNDEIERKKNAAKEGRQLSPRERAAQDRQITVETINLKEIEYQSHVASAYSLYGHNPFFLMKELPFRKIVDGVNSTPSDLLGAYNAINQAYRSALELKRISLENNILASQLPGLAETSNQAEAASWVGQAIDESLVTARLSSSDVEKNIRIQLLANFLQEEIVNETGSVEGLTHSQSLEKHHSTVVAIISREQSLVGSYVRTNPNINSPLSKPELEALKNLVSLQAKTDLGKRWEDYHVSLLHSETVRHLTNTRNALENLIDRAREAEGLLEQARLALAAEAERMALEQARIAVEAEAEAQRVAVEQARIAAEAKAETLRVATETAAALAEEASYKEAVSFLADTNKHILEKYGANIGKVARDLQNNISGKKIRSYSEALASFEKISANPRLKLNAKDTRAVVDALNALDKASFADNVNRLGKAFGVVGKIVQAESIREKTVIGFETGDWKPLGVEIEALAIGSLAAFAAGAFLATVFAMTGALVIISVPFIAVVMALSAAYFDAERIDEINSYFLNLAVGPGEA